MLTVLPLLAATTKAEVQEGYTRFGRFITERAPYIGDPTNSGTGCYGLEILYKQELGILTSVPWDCQCNSSELSVICETSHDGETCCDGQCGIFSTGISLDVDNIDNIHFQKSRKECYKPVPHAKYFCVESTWAANSTDTYDSCAAFVQDTGNCISCKMNTCATMGSEHIPSFNCSNAPALPLSGECPAYQYTQNLCTFTPDDVGNGDGDEVASSGVSTAKTISVAVAVLLLGSEPLLGAFRAV